MASRPFVIGIEEHYAEAEIMALWRGYDANKTAEVTRRLLDLTGERIENMDRFGIDFQVLSHSAPAGQKLDPETSIKMARIANDRLAETVRMHPKRFAGFAICRRRIH